MRPSIIYRAAHARTPLIKFLGKRSPPKSVDHTPHPHPASPTHELPESFASYRARAQQHGPLGGKEMNSSSSSSTSSPPSINLQSFLAYGAVGGTAGKNLGPVQPKEGEYFDISELPQRFHRRAWSEEEIDAVSSAGASMW